MSKLQKQIQMLAEKIHSFNYDRKGYYLGRILTITDAVTTDPQQRKAIKDLVEQVFWGDSFPGQDDPISYHIKQFAKAQGIDPLYDSDPIDELSEVNQYNEIN